MDRINGAGHVGHMFVAEDVPTNRPPTEITEDWLNTIQEELAAIPEGAGMTLDPNNRAQLREAIQRMIDAGLTMLHGRNVIVNGSCAISQVNGTTLVTPTSGSYMIDNVGCSLGAASKLQTQQVFDKLNSLGAVSALNVSVLNSYAAGAGEVFHLRFPVEGLNFARFQYGTANAKAGSLQFKVRASIAGTYSGVLSNYAENRSYPFTFTVAANTDTLVKIENIPGDTGGAWVGATNAGAFYVKFDLGTGATYKSATANAWQAANYSGVTGSTNLVSQVNGSTISITDVQFEVGAFCTQFERKLYDQNLRECQRYLPVYTGGVSNANSTGPYISGAFGLNGVQAISTITFPVPTRAAITGVVTPNVAHIGFSAPSGNHASSSLTLGQNGMYGVQLISAVTGVTAGEGGMFYFNNTAGQLCFTGAQI